MRRFRRCVPPSALALALALAALPVGAVCTSFTTPALASVPAAGAADTVTVPVTLCQTTPWNATADVPWITASGGNSGVFEATSVVVSYTVAPNPTNAPRVGRITGLPAGVLPFEITQAGSDVTVVPTLHSIGLVILACVLAALALARVAAKKAGALSGRQ